MVAKVIVTARAANIPASVTLETNECWEEAKGDDMPGRQGAWLGIFILDFLKDRMTA